MPRFVYAAIEVSSGRERRGAVESATPETAIAALKETGLYPTELAAAAPAAVAPRAADAVVPAPGLRGLLRRLSFGSSVSRAELRRFTRQLATLGRAGMPLLRGLQVLARQEKPGGYRAMIEDVADAIAAGGSLSDGLARHPRVFDALYVNLVKAGEAGGVLDVVLDRLAGLLEKSEKLRGRVRAAMTYPIIIMVVAAAIVGALLVFVIPKFEGVFQSVLKGQPLPGLTQAVLDLSRCVQEHAGATLIALGGAALAGFALRRMPRVRRGLDMLVLRLPAVGPLALKAAVARFTRTFGTLLASGVPILDALRIAREVSGNTVVAAALQVVHDRVKAGESVARPLEAAAIFPGLVTSMIDVGEETGALPEMLGRIADTYDDEVDNAVASLTALLEPLMIVVMALLVGTVVIALFLPIVRIVQALS